MKTNYCEYCFNARVYDDPSNEYDETPLTDTNDFSSHSVGTSLQKHRLMISSGCGKPLRIEVDHWNEQREEWVTVGRYTPNYCPNCGRKLDEYNKE